MISAAEILERAGELSLRPEIVEKDYVLGWLLAGIAEHPVLRDQWVFKGGTCLKKVHFETYRFSEDLDFTVKEGAHLNEAFLRQAIAEVARAVYEACGLEIPQDQIRFDVYTNKRGGQSAEGRVYFRGPLRPGGSLPRIKLDLTADEVIVLNAERLRVVHPYTDEPSGGITVLSYPFAEVFAEKIRALAERGRPRDLYDVVNLFRREEARSAERDIRRCLDEKCRFKGIPVPALETIQAHRVEIEADWEAMLGLQLPVLPPLDTFWGELPALFRWLREEEAPAAPVPYPLRSDERPVYVGLGGFRAAGIRGGLLEVVRFAAGSHLCVDLDYVDKQGNFNTRTIEPYSLRTTSEGHYLLHAERADGSGHRTYRVDRIQGARATKRGFVPRFAIELSASGPMSAPSSAQRFVDPRGTRSATKRRGGGLGPTYVYQCSFCGKRFDRSRHDASLRPHKDKNGWPCAGRVGYLVNTRY